jgi:hypothetical protein
MAVNKAEASNGVAQTLAFPTGVWERGDGEDGYLNDRAGEVAEQIPNPVAGVEELPAEDEHAEKDDGDDDGEEGPGPDVELVVGRRLGAHGGKVKGKGEKVKGRRPRWDRT